MNTKSKNPVLIFIIIISIVLSTTIVQGTPNTPTITPNTACADQQSFSNLVCQQQPDSNLGYGAVDICGSCFACGVSDGVCPEDFYSNAYSLQASCNKCPDPDCTGAISVEVSSQETPVHSFNVTLTYATGETQELGTTNSQGFVNENFNTLSSSGEITVRAQREGFIILEEETELIRGENLTIEFTNAQEAPCEADCTRGGVCDMNCASQCSYPSNEMYESSFIASTCNGRELNDTVYLGKENNMIYFAKCCAQGIFSKERPQININDYQTKIITGLVNHVQSVLVDNERVFLVVNTFNKEAE